MAKLLSKVQKNPYLWVHLIGLAAVPLLLDICWLGVASAGPAPVFGLQFWVIAAFGILPPLWMQIVRPFYLFSLPPLALQIDQLTLGDRRCLQVLKSWQIKALALVTAAFSGWLLRQVYGRATQIEPFLQPTAGLIVAAVTFFFICLFLQISASVLRSLLISPETLKRVSPYEPEAITSDFLMVGLPLKRLLPRSPDELADSALP